MDEAYIREALAELDQELKGAGQERVKVRLASPYAHPRVRWLKVAEWCHRHPGVTFTLDRIYENALRQFKVNFPEIDVWGSHYRIDKDDGRRVITLHGVYRPPVVDPVAEEDWMPKDWKAHPGS